MSITRLENHENLLHAYIETQRDTEFAWGTSDCLVFAAQCVKAMTGTDVLAGVKYTDERSALRVMRNGATIKGKKLPGPGSIPAFWDTHFPRLESTNFAHTGDIVTFTHTRNLIGQDIATGTMKPHTVRSTLGLSGIVAFDGRTVVAMTEDGLALFSINDCDTAWHTQSGEDA